MEQFKQFSVEKQAVIETLQKLRGIIKELENMGIEDGETVRMYDFEFDYYK